MPQYASLQDIMDQSRQRADQVNSTFVAEEELILAVNASAKKLHDLLVSAYGDEYFFDDFSGNFTVDLAEYPVPANFYKLLGVDFETGPGTGKFTVVDRYQNRQRNRDVVYTYTGIYAYTGTLLEYRLRGGNLVFAPPPTDTRLYKINYTPTARKLIKQTLVAADIIFASDQITVTAHGLLADAPVQFTTKGTLPAPLAADTVYFAIIVNVNTIQVAATAGGTAIDLTDAGSDGHTIMSAFDGINGYEDFIVVDVARKMLDKEESDSRHLVAEKVRIIGELEQISRNRDTGEPEKITDVDPFGSILFPLRFPPTL